MFACTPERLNAWAREVYLLGEASPLSFTFASRSPLLTVIGHCGPSRLASPTHRTRQIIHCIPMTVLWQGIELAVLRWALALVQDDDRLALLFGLAHFGTTHNENSHSC